MSGEVPNRLPNLTILAISLLLHLQARGDDGPIHRMIYPTDTSDLKHHSDVLKSGREEDSCRKSMRYEVQRQV
jgi:hypothetical protein